MTDWVSASAILAAGIILGLMFVFFVRRRPAAAAAVPAGDLDLRDLEAKRDALVEQLRGLDPMNADERTRLELETAQVLRQIDERRKASRPPAPVAAPASDPLRRATLIGFGWGAGSVLLLAVLGYMVMQQASTRQPNAPLTGSETTTVTPAQAPPDPGLQQLEAAVQKSPDDLNMRLDLAKAYLERDNLMAVFDQTQLILKKAPNEPHALTYQALVRMAMGQSADADKMLERATKVDPSLLDAWVALAWAKTSEGKTKEADAAIAEAQRHHPEEKARLDQVYAQMKQQAAARRSGGGTLPVDHPQIGTAEAPVEQPIHVTLDVDPGAKVRVGPNAVLFVFARPEGVTAGPPSAVKRLVGVTFPMTFDLGSADSMMGQPLPPRVRLEARLDSDGNAMTKDPGDPDAVQDGVALGSSVTLKLH